MPCRVSILHFKYDGIEVLKWESELSNSQAYCSTMSFSYLVGERAAATKWPGVGSMMLSPRVRRWMLVRARRRSEVFVARCLRRGAATAFWSAGLATPCSGTCVRRATLWRVVGAGARAG